MDEFGKAPIVKKANIYFEGKVITCFKMVKRKH